jgi:ABC-2 type transport system permease protein
MFRQIFLFELKYRLRRPAFYIYFTLVLAASIFGIAQAGVPLKEHEFINSPASLALFFSNLSVFLMLVSAVIMGTPLYRDLEYGTKEYYLSYPITKNGYFWGRCLGSFFFVALIGAAVPIGAWLGTHVGPLLHWQIAEGYGSNQPWFYLQPYLTLILPNLFFTSALFFGLVAFFRNVKVIYSSAMFLFLGYLLANFFLQNTNDLRVIYLGDPWLISGLRNLKDGWTVARLNHSVIPMTGLVLVNRLIWTSVGAIVLAFTWWRFSFERFFSGRQGGGDKGAAQTPAARPDRTGIRTVHVELEGGYYRRTLFSLTRIEVLNLIRDGYFWTILSGGIVFLALIFWHTPTSWRVGDYPRTVYFMNAFANNFMFFVFLIIVFYTGETVHREKLTRYAFINDALPPPDWVFATGKILGLLCVVVGIALIPVILGLIIQLLKGYSQFNLPEYAAIEFVSVLPKMTELVLFCFAVHMIVNNKFAAHGIAITVYILMQLASIFNYFTYNLLLYSNSPLYLPSDMDGIGHMVRPVLWFQGYWTVAGGLLVVIGGLFFARGVDRSARERLRLVVQRFHGSARAGFGALLVIFLAVGGFIYYNVSYQNEYLTRWERRERAAIAERRMKHYASMPLPRVTSLRLAVDLYPDQQREETMAWATLTNKGDRPIDSLLIDGDGLDFTISQNGVVMPYTCPLYFPAGKFNLFRPRREPSDYRMYVLPATLRPGDSIRLQVHSTLAFAGFQNFFYGGSCLHNGIFTGGNLPGLGYDDDDELGDNDVRRDHGLPVKKEVDIPQDDPAGRRNLLSGWNGDLIVQDLTVSTAEGQWVQSTGHVGKEWTAGGRHFFHFVQDNPGIYPPFGIVSARYARLNDTVQLEGGRIVKVEIDYHPANGVNVGRFLTAVKDGLRYYSRAFGPYPYDRLSVVEASIYARWDAVSPGVLFFAERNGWNADFRGPDKFNYIYYTVAFDLAQQWWTNVVAPNATLGSDILRWGLARYSALALMQAKMPASQLNTALGDAEWNYDWQRHNDNDSERTLLYSNRYYEWDEKAGLALFALGKKMGFDSLNAALHDLRDEWGLRREGPYAGAPDLYNVLQAHVPDSLRAGLKRDWEGPKKYLAVQK